MFYCSNGPVLRIRNDFWIVAPYVSFLLHPYLSIFFGRPIRSAVTISLLLLVSNNTNTHISGLIRLRKFDRSVLTRFLIVSNNRSPDSGQPSEHAVHLGRPNSAGAVTINGPYSTSWTSCAENTWNIVTNEQVFLSFTTYVLLTCVSFFAVCGIADKSVRSFSAEESLIRHILHVCVFLRLGRYKW